MILLVCLGCARAMCSVCLALGLVLYIVMLCFRSHYGVTYKYILKVILHFIKDFR